MFRSALNTGLLLAVMAVVAREAAGAEWHYSDVDHWGDDFPNCGGQQQSPININTRRVRRGDISPILFHNYDVVPASQSVTNDGHSIKVGISSTSAMPYLKWRCGWFGSCKYNFAQYHFHWGSVSFQGSEHTIDTVSYPMELHLVHYNDKYSIDEAVTQPNGLAVLGIMFVISRRDNPALAPLLAAMAEVQDYNSDPDTVYKDNLVALASLLPSDTDSFYRYAGGLTTPTCDESVLWTVFAQPIKVSEAQMEVFRSIVGLDGPSGDNYRPPQPLNGRKVEKTFK